MDVRIEINAEAAMTAGSVCSVKIVALDHKRCPVMCPDLQLQAVLTHVDHYPLRVREIDVFNLSFCLLSTWIDMVCCKTSALLRVMKLSRT
jgi:hypothetical protein